MNGELAQIVTLVTYGNLFLSGKEVDLTENSTFQYVSSFKFARYKSNKETRGVEIAGSVTDWFGFFKTNHVTHLWNVAFAWDGPDLPEHIAAAFAGSVPPRH